MNWEAANKYLIGLFFNNLILVSGLVAFGAFIAFAWRSLDLDSVRDFLGMFDLESAVFTALLPFFAFMSVWVMAWVISYFKHEAEAPGTWAQRWLYFMAASLFIGLVILLVNPETKVGFLRVFVGNGKMSDSETISRWLLGLLGAGLVPFLAPDKLLKFGQNPQNVWQRGTFHVAMFALLVGVPLLVVGVLGKPNISDTLRDPDDNLRAADVVSWPTLISLMQSSNAPLSSKETDEFNDLKARITAGTLHMWDPNQQKTIGHLRNLARRNLAAQVRDLETKMQERDQWNARLDEFPNRWERFAYLLGWLSGDDNPLLDYWNANSEVVARQDAACRDFSKYVLGSKTFPQAILAKNLLMQERDGVPDDNPDDAVKRLKQEQEKLSLIFGQLFPSSSAEKKDDIKDQGLTPEEIDEAEGSYLTWSPSSLKEFNLSLLRATHPECFFDRDTVYRQVVINPDQRRRANVFCVAFGVFALAALLVNMNSTSLHRFYRNRIKYAYLVPRRRAGPIATCRI